MRKTTWGLLWLVLAVGVQPIRAQVVVAPQGAIDPGVQKFLDKWVTAWNAHDSDAILRLHAEDCVTVNRFGTLFPDKQATAKQMEFLQKKLFKDAQFPPPADTASAQPHSGHRRVAGVLAESILDAAASAAGKRHDRDLPAQARRFRLAGRTG
jgi:hypothetical protein